MKSKLFLLGIGICAMIAIFITHTDSQTKPKPPILRGDEAQIRELVGNLTTAIQARDADRVMRVYAQREDLVIFDVGPDSEYKGWEAYRNEWLRFFGSIVRIDRCDYRVEQVRASGILGYASGKWRTTFVAKAGGTTTLEGRFTFVLEKINGIWRIIHEHSSMPTNDVNTPDAEPIPPSYLQFGVRGDGTSGIQGTALISPVRGGPIRVGDAPHKSFPNTTVYIQLQTNEQNLVKQTTDKNGRYRIALAPGKYRITGDPPFPGAPGPRPLPQFFEVKAGQYTKVDIRYDSGMR